MKGLLAALLFLALAAPAQASFTVTPSTTQAGAPADVTIHADFATTPGRVALHLPPGLVGNPNAASRCALQTFRAASCAAASRVGIGLGEERRSSRSPAASTTSSPSRASRRGWGSRSNCWA